MPFRIQPSGPVHAYKTYEVRASYKGSHATASCKDVACPNYLRGWYTTVDEGLELGRKQAHYIRHESGRHYAEERLQTGLTRFTFEAGQTCFETHQVAIRPAKYLVKGGDWRGNPRQEFKVHASPEDWIDDFRESADKLTTAIERG